jgi:hypothetical protein
MGALFILVRLVVPDKFKLWDNFAKLIFLLSPNSQCQVTKVGFGV